MLQKLLNKKINGEQKGSALLALLVSGAILSLGVMSVMQTISSASLFNGLNHTKTIAASYVTEFADYIRAKPMEEIVSALGAFPVGVSINDTNGLFAATCSPVPSPLGSPQPVSDLSAALPLGVLGGPKSSERGYTIGMVDLTTNKNTVFPCGTNLTTAAKSLDSSSSLRLTFNVFVAWKDLKGAWQIKTSYVLGAGAPKIPIAPKPVPPPPPRLTCNIAIHNFGTYGCGPGKAEHFSVSIPEVPSSSFISDSGLAFDNNYFTSTNPPYQALDLVYKKTVDLQRFLTSAYPAPIWVRGSWGNSEQMGYGPANMQCYYGRDYSSTPNYVPGTGAGGQGPLPMAINYGGNVYPFWTCTVAGKGVTPCDPVNPKGVNCLCDPGSTACAVITQTFSPLVLDYSGNGVALTAPSGGPLFDLIGSGHPGIFSWPIGERKTMFLALDRNGNGNIDNINELFGNNTVGPDGQKASNGFEALKKYDKNKDGVIDAKDEIFSYLRFWADDNEDGTVQRGELFSLNDLGITGIDLNYIDANERNDFYGNFSRERSVVDMKDGTFRTILDVWLVQGSSQNKETH